MIYRTIQDAKEAAKKAVLNAYEIPAGVWQGTDQFKDEIMLEFWNFGLQVEIPQLEEELAIACNADLPWAEEHFQERIFGIPMNPGLSYRIWPYNKFKEDGNDPYLKRKKFSHTYMERYWPKKAGHDDKEHWRTQDLPFREGIRYAYGDLSDVVKLLRANKLTRQAYLPVWFPEDTGATHGERVPCSIGYHFYIRGGRLHCNYYIRSCDLYRHFKNDIYLTGRLMQHIANMVGEGELITPGFLRMDIGSLHLFKNDLYHFKKGNY